MDLLGGCLTQRDLLGVIYTVGLVLEYRGIALMMCYCNILMLELTFQSRSKLILDFLLRGLVLSIHMSEKEGFRHVGVQIGVVTDYTICSVWESYRSQK